MVAFKILPIASNPKSIEERKEQLCKLKTFYEERLGLEIRRTHSKFPCAIIQYG